MAEGAREMNLFEAIELGGELPETAVYAHRAWAWQPEAGCAGRLTITLQKGKRAGCKIERDSYLIELLPPLPGFIGRRFQLSNLTDPAVSEVYETQVGYRPGEWTCTCKAGQYKAPSDKHADALRAAMLAGAFEGVKQPEPVVPKGPWVVRT